MKEVLLSQEELEIKLTYWKEKLRLQDWEIEVSIRRKNDMEFDALAIVNWTLSKKMATIRVLDQIDYDHSCMGVRDMENDLIHELLHLHFAPINDHFSNDNDVYSTFEEQAIESITSGLINANRGL